MSIRSSESPPEAAYRRHPDLVICERGADLLVMPAPGGLADLTRAVRLAGSGRRLWDATGEGAAPIGELASGLETNVARAAGDARAFLDELTRRGLLVREDDAPPAAGEPGEPGDAGVPGPGPPRPALEAADVEGLVRAALRGGRRVRFPASGASMRPQVPHGSVLEVEPLPPGRPRRGAILLYGHWRHRLVAHRFWRRRGARFLMWGDSSARVDDVAPEDVLGVVAARWTGHGENAVRRPLSSAWSRWTGLLTGWVYRCLLAPVRILVVAPLRSTFPSPSLVRRGLLVPLRAAGWMLHRAERAAFLARQRVQVLRAALMSSAEKDADRSRLYERRAIREMTAMDENLEAGLTLLEEVIFHRHDIRSGRLLVLGCGPGRECVALAERGYEVCGLDRDPAMLELGRELARRHGADVDLVEGEACELELEGRCFDVVAIFSGLYNMVIPSSRRIGMLAAARRHLVPGGQVLVTFLSAYVRPGSPRPGRSTTILTAINEEHEPGDLYLVNEAVHIFPRADDVAAEAAAAGLVVRHLFRDQRFYDRATGQVRGYAVLENPAAAGGNADRAEPDDHRP